MKSKIEEMFDKSESLDLYSFQEGARSLLQEIEKMAWELKEDTRRDCVYLDDIKSLFEAPCSLCGEVQSNHRDDICATKYAMKEADEK